jgi:hypothetical protein
MPTRKICGIRPSAAPWRTLQRAGGHFSARYGELHSPLEFIHFFAGQAVSPVSFVAHDRAWRRGPIPRSARFLASAGTRVLKPTPGHSESETLACALTPHCQPLTGGFPPKWNVVPARIRAIMISRMVTASECPNWLRTFKTGIRLQAHSAGCPTKLASSENSHSPLWREAYPCPSVFICGSILAYGSACIGGSFVPPRPEPIFISMGGRNAGHGVSFVQNRISRPAKPAIRPRAHSPRLPVRQIGFVRPKIASAVPHPKCSKLASSENSHSPLWREAYPCPSVSICGSILALLIGVHRRASAVPSFLLTPSPFSSPWVAGMPTAAFRSFKIASAVPHPKCSELASFVQNRHPAPAALPACPPPNWLRSGQARAVLALAK